MRQLAIISVLLVANLILDSCARVLSSEPLESAAWHKTPGYELASCDPATSAFTSLPSGTGVTVASQGVRAGSEWLKICLEFNQLQPNLSFKPYDVTLNGKIKPYYVTLSGKIPFGFVGADPGKEVSLARQTRVVWVVLSFAVAKNEITEGTSILSIHGLSAEGKSLDVPPVVLSQRWRLKELGPKGFYGVPAIGGPSLSTIPGRIRIFH